ncbi:tRNA pseudouridine(38-40) synthase TruA [uncultured Maribacter sp.]|uniref:tRNA pseudouridine(38-40) synthase TruA n=1 Tax=uncultured Maribacter sp. TaxID=431308 RepID=UPI00262FA736|nr:tRNA pseudouridine(38-40) synthase TruA [uncultured Maribacter sp.]
MRFFIQFSYFGKDYHGWQRQPNAITVQEVLEGSLSTILSTKVVLTGAGRTDAGVHAKQMYAHFNLDKILEVEELVYRVNSLLPEDIAVQRIVETKEDAHARFDATARTYEYWITKKKDPFCIDTSHYIKQSINIGAMNQAAKILLKEKDFECFSKSNTDVYTYLCNITQAKWEQKGNLLVFTITANRFLRNMVRAIVGTLLEVGMGKIKVEDVNTIIKSKDRAQAGVSVPAKGLYLTQVLYPKTTIDFYE